MEKEGKVLDISQVVAAPVLIGETNLPFWTGVVRADRINQYLIKDDTKREEFIELVREYEKYVIQYRELDKSQKAPLEIGALRTKNIINRNQERKILESKILEFSRKIKMILNNPNNGIDMELFWIMLCCDYEKVLKENRKEFSHMSEDAKKSLKTFKRTVDSRNIALREMYVPSSNEYMGVAFFTEEQSKKYAKGEKNSGKIVELVKSITGKDVVSSSEGMSVLEELFETIFLSDYFEIFPDNRYAKLQYVTTFKNYLLRIGYTYEQIQEMDGDTLRDTVMETYDKQGLEHHKVLVAKSIKNGIRYIDLERLLLISAMRHLVALEGITVQIRKSDSELESSSLEERQLESQTTEGIIHEDIIVRAHDHEEVVEKIKYVEQMLKKILELKLIKSSTKVNIVINGEYKEITVKNIEELMANFCDGIYVTEQLIESYKFKAFIDENEIEKWSDEFLQRVEFKDRDIIVLSLINFNNFRRLYEAGKIDKDCIMMILAIIENGSLKETLTSNDIVQDYQEQASKVIENSSDFLQFAFNEGIISFGDLKLFYDKRVIKFSDLENLESRMTPDEQKSFRKSLGEQINEQEFLIAYKDFIEHRIRYEKAVKENNSDYEIYKETLEIKRREKDSQLMLLKKYKLQDLSVEEKNQIIENMLLTYCLDMEHEDEITITESLREMYKDGIITFEHIAKLDETYLQTVIIDIMFVRGELTLDDTKKLREALSIEELTGILNKAMTNTAITQTQKISLIMNIFHNGIEDEKIAQKFLRQLHAEKYEGVKHTDLIGEVYTQTDNSRVNNTTTKTYDKSKEWVYPKYVKWMFLNALDKDAIITVYSNGYVEAYSRKLNVRIVEKYFEIDDEGNRFGRDAYGFSTFIVKESAYRDNLEHLVDSFAGQEPLLNPRTLSAIVPKEDRIRHNTHSQSKNWMRYMAKYFDIDLETDLDLLHDTRYTREELEHIREVIITYENAYVDRNEDR